LESLPVELQRNFKLMRELDDRAQKLMREIDVLGEEYLKLSKTVPPERKKELSSNIQVSCLFIDAFNLMATEYVTVLIAETGLRTQIRDSHDSKAHP
jgi:hypothetical protein